MPEITIFINQFGIFNSDGYQFSELQEAIEYCTNYRQKYKIVDEKQIEMQFEFKEQQ